MDTKELYREILNEHNINPNHKKDLEGSTISLNGVNPSCGDNITLNLKVSDGTSSKNLPNWMCIAEDRAFSRAWASCSSSPS